MAVPMRRDDGAVIEVADENVERYEADGWQRVQSDEPKKTSRKTGRK